MIALELKPTAGRMGGIPTSMSPTASETGGSDTDSVIVHVNGFLAKNRKITKETVTSVNNNGPLAKFRKVNNYVETHY